MFRIYIRLLLYHGGERGVSLRLFSAKHQQLFIEITGSCSKLESTRIPARSVQLVAHMNAQWQLKLSAKLIIVVTEQEHRQR